MRKTTVCTNFVPLIRLASQATFPSMGRLSLDISFCTNIQINPNLSFKFGVVGELVLLNNGRAMRASTVYEE